MIKADIYNQPTFVENLLFPREMFSSRGASEPEPIPLCPLLTEIIRGLSRSQTEDITIMLSRGIQILEHSTNSHKPLDKINRDLGLKNNTQILIIIV